MAKTIDELDELIAVTIAEREKITRSYDNKIEQYNRMITKLIRDQLNEQPSWEFILDASRRNMDAYRYCQKFFPEGVMFSGVFPEVGQSRLMLHMKRDDKNNLMETFEFLSQVLPFYKGDHIAILRHDGGEDGNWVLRRIENEWCVIDLRADSRKRGDNKGVPEFRESLILCLAYISKIHWGQE
uniref:Uncharacterized protein n=1 Tax=Ochrobactrum phage ORM_20 TaxID=2985243 RepID=A0A9N6WS62_9VIRU|nr:hypothetical protein ORM20_00188 [Ochrobactrum phage ORM_20]